MHKYDVECECEECEWVRSVCDATDAWQYNGACSCERCLEWARWNVPVQGCQTAWEAFTRRTRTIDRPNFRGLVVDGWWVDSYEAVDMSEAWPFPSWEEGGVVVNKAQLYQLWLDGKVQ